MLSSIIERLKKKRQRRISIQKTITLFLPILFISFLFISLIAPVSAYDIVVENNVDADSDIDSTANIGDDGATDYTDAQTLDGTDQVIVEAQGAGQASQQNISDTFDSYITDIDSYPDVGTDASWSNAQAITNDGSYMTMQEANQGGAGTGGQLPSAKATIVSDTTTSTTFEDVDGLTVQLTIDYTSDILLFAAIECLSSSLAMGSWRLVFDGENFQELFSRVSAQKRNLVLVDLVSSKSAGTYTFKLQHKISTSNLETADSIIVAISLHNTEGTVPANNSFTASDTNGGASWLDISGLSTEITLSRTSHIWAMMTTSASLSKANKDADFAINIDATRMEVHDRDWASILDDYRSVSINTRTDTTKSAGTYTVKAEWKGSGGSVITGKNFSLVVIAAEANNGADIIDIQKVVVASDSTSSQTMENIDNLNTTDITVNGTAHILGILTLPTNPFGISTAYITINLNGTDQEVMERYHSNNYRDGSMGQIVRSDSTYSQGTANATGRWYVSYEELSSANIILTTIVLYAGSAGGGGDDFELDFEYQFTSADFDNTYEYVCTYVDVASQNGENLVAYEWSGAWYSLGTLSSNGWNNFTLTYLIGATYYIRFIDSDQSDESIQSMWNVDCIFLRTSNNEIDDYELSWEHQVQSVDNDKSEYLLCIYGYSSSGTESFEIQMWNFGGSQWDIPLTTDIDNIEQWYNQTISLSYIDGSDQITWRYRGTIETSDSTQDTLYIDWSGVRAYNFSVYGLLANFDSLEFSPDSSYHAFNNSPLEFVVESGKSYDVQIKGTDNIGTAIADGFIYYNTVDDTGSTTVLITSYVVFYNDQSAGNNTHYIYVWVNWGWSGGDSGVTDGTRSFDIDVQIINA